MLLTIVWDYALSPRSSCINRKRALFQNWSVRITRHYTCDLARFIKRHPSAFTWLAINCPIGWHVWYFNRKRASLLRKFRYAPPPTRPSCFNSGSEPTLLLWSRPCWQLVYCWHLPRGHRVHGYLETEEELSCLHLHHRLVGGGSGLEYEEPNLLNYLRSDTVSDTATSSVWEQMDQFCWTAWCPSQVLHFNQTCFKDHLLCFACKAS